MFDAATFHQVLSNAALNMAALRSRDLAPEMHESMVHHAKAVTLVKKSMLDKQTATSDNVIAGITGFACYAVCEFSLSPKSFILTQYLACYGKSTRVAYAYECGARDSSSPRRHRQFKHQQAVADSHVLVFPPIYLSSLTN